MLVEGLLGGAGGTRGDDAGAALDEVGLGHVVVALGLVRRRLAGRQGEQPEGERDDGETPTQGHELAYSFEGERRNGEGGRRATVVAARWRSPIGLVLSGKC